MKMKPRSTVRNPRALLYRRFTRIEQAQNLEYIYNTTEDNLFWTFNVEDLEFTQINSDLVPASAKITSVSSDTILQYQSHYFKYGNGEWNMTDTLPNGTELLSATFNNIGKYQTNKYYFVGSFDYMIKGSIEGTTTQYIKGNIIPLTSMNIKYFEDNLKITVDDLVVIDKHLYSVENPETVQKRMPNVFNIYFATLNSIL